jgi:DNA-binding MarR family transcriptional regulator
MFELSREPLISQNGLAAKLRLEKSTVSRIVTSLAKRGWLERMRDSDDSRVVRLRLTRLGTRVVGNLTKSRAEKFSRVFEAIPPHRRAAVLESLSLLSEVLNED